MGFQAAGVSILDWRHFRVYKYPGGSAPPRERDYENEHPTSYNAPMQPY